MTVKVSFRDSYMPGTAGPTPDEGVYLYNVSDIRLEDSRNTPGQQNVKIDITFSDEDNPESVANGFDYTTNITVPTGGQNDRVYLSNLFAVLVACGFDEEELKGMDDVDLSDAEAMRAWVEEQILNRSGYLYFFPRRDRTEEEVAAGFRTYHEVIYLSPVMLNNLNDGTWKPERRPEKKRPAAVPPQGPPANAPSAPAQAPRAPAAPAAPARPSPAPARPAPAAAPPAARPAPAPARPAPARGKPPTA